MARKPTPQEFKQTVIICGIGLFILGAIGFAMLVLMDNFIPYVIHDVFNIENAKR
jgi:protein translocase SEC61 complex gamma subunit